MRGIPLDFTLKMRGGVYARDKGRIWGTLRYILQTKSLQSFMQGICAPTKSTVASALFRLRDRPINEEEMWPKSASVHTG